MNEVEIEKQQLLSSLLDFTRIYYKHRTGRDFIISNPIGRESHFITICRELVKVARGETKRLIINIPPRYGKTELVIHFVAWTLGLWPDSNYLYVSYSHSLAKKQTQTIRSIILNRNYQSIIGVKLRDDIQAKDNFETEEGGSVYAVGAGGTITGRGAGIHGCGRFGGCIILDDIHKPDEVTSDTIREGVLDWYDNTLQSRINSINTPIIFIGQRLHEDDLPAKLISTGEWSTLILPSIDAAGNALYPEMHSLPVLRKMQEESPYHFSSQYQQDPQPAGGGIFKPEWFHLHGLEPKILMTFITCDTAETDKNWNDATVFSFWGLYKIAFGDAETDEYALHWLDCIEIRVEPKDLETEFLTFYMNALKHKKKPSFVAIEKKSTGTTLISILKKRQGISVYELESNVRTGSKTKRFLETQPFVAQGRISLPASGRHTDMCINHCKKITANDTHRWDDIADTLAYAVQLTFIEGIPMQKLFASKDYSAMAKDMARSANRIENLRRSAFKQ